MIISVASGKGGTGKTTVAVNLALAMGKVQLLDCDVEEPNSAIFLKPEIKSTESVSLPVPVVDRSKCVYCGKCAEVCAYGALSIFKAGAGEVLFLPHLCHNCGACSFICPEKAVSEKDYEIGKIESGSSGQIEYYCGRLNIGEIKSPSLIKILKRKIKPELDAVLDCPPGTSCPMMAAVKESDFCILVTEPTPFGLHDLTLAAETVRKLGIKFGVFLNRAGGSDIIENYCCAEGIELLGRIPFDRELASLYSRGGTFSDIRPEYKRLFENLAKDILGRGRK